MRFAYADPPYLGCAVRLYGDHPDAAVYDTIDGHRSLIDSLMDFDGWAYSMTSTTIGDLAPLMPDGARWGAWVKTFAPFKPNVNPAYMWEPVVFYGGRKRKRDKRGVAALTIRDWVSSPVMQNGFKGAKPAPFTRWILDVLNVQPDDEFVDVFPGSGAVGRAVDEWRAARPLPFAKTQELLP